MSGSPRSATGDAKSLKYDRGLIRACCLILKLAIEGMVLTFSNSEMFLSKYYSLLAPKN
jgi:hypothetical protein